MKKTDEHYKMLLITPCESKEHLNLWLKTFLDVELIDTTVSRYANTNPLDAAWLVYNRALHSKVKEPLNVLFVASRGSQKTLMSAAIELAVAIHDRRDILHFAGSKDQVEAGYKYIREFLHRKYIRDLVDGKVTNEGADLLIPNFLDPNDVKTVTIRVFPITLMSVQGQHSPYLSVDELLTLSFDKLKAYRDLSGVPIPTSDGRPFIRSEISSRKGAFSLVEEKIATAHKTKLKISSWTIFELTEKCQDERSGITPTKYFTSVHKGLALSPEKYAELTEAEQTGFQEIEAFDGCANCPLLSTCSGDLKKQTSTNKHLRSIESVIQESEQNSIEWFLSQKMCLMPSTEGLIYNKFKKDTHVIDNKRAWEILTGTEIDHTPSYTQLVNKFKELECACYVGVDHTGGTAPCSVVVGYVDKKDNLFIVDVIYEAGLELEDLVNILKRFQIQYNYKMIFPDPAASDKNKILRKNNLPVMFNFKKDIAAGIENVRSKVMSSTGLISLYCLQGRTDELINEFGKYHYKEAGDGSGFTAEPAESYSHAQDALRYLVSNVFGRSISIQVPEYTAQELEEKRYNQMSDIDILVKDKIQEAIRKETGNNEGVQIEQGDGFFWIF